MILFGAYLQIYFMYPTAALLFSFCCVAHLYVLSGSQQDRKFGGSLHQGIVFLTTDFLTLLTCIQTVQVSDTTGDAIFTKDRNKNIYRNTKSCSAKQNSFLMH